MFVAQIQFLFDSADEDGEAQDAVLSILAAMYQNGQISTNGYLLLDSSSGFLSFVSIPAEDALESCHNNEWVEKAIERFVQLGGKAPAFTVIGQDAESAGSCQCEQPAGYILFTNFLSLESPLRCDYCFGPVPLYRVPPTYNESEYWNLRHWEADYQACDTLQMGCTVLERSTMRQMSQLNSALTQSGLKICQLISASTNQPVYYYLYVHAGIDVDSEMARKCPKCGGSWLLKEPWHGQFDFKCDKCYLLSNIAFGVRETYISED